MELDNSIEIIDVKKQFKVYFDKGQSLKERLLFHKRNRYENRTVLNGITFNVKKGEVVGLIGENGCGKSTLLKLMTKIMYPDSGTIEIKGRISSLIELGAGFHPDMSGRENIYTNASIFGLTKKEIDERLDDIIEFSELAEFIDNPVRTYSSGMYMRLAFAVAINVDADVLLIDEILAVGDTNFQAKCFDHLRQLKSSGITIVIVSHDLGMIERFCNKAVWINNGEIASIGKSTDVVDDYLTFMNNKKIALLENQSKAEIERQNMDKQSEDAQQETAEASEEAADSAEQIPESSPEASAVSEENTGSSSGMDEHLYQQAMDYNCKHFGTKEAVLTKVVLKNHRHEETLLLEAGKEFYIDFYYHVNKPIDEYVFGMGIYTLEGEWIFGTNTLLAHKQVILNDTDGKIEYKGKEMNLLTSKYILQVSITDINGTPLDFYREYYQFDVINNHRDAGIVYMDNDWEIQ